MCFIYQVLGFWWERSSVKKNQYKCIFATLWVNKISRRRQLKRLLGMMRY